MEREAILTHRDGWSRLVLLEDGVPVEIWLEEAGQASAVGSLYMGRVERVLPGMHAAFVDIGGERNAFLSLDDVPAGVDGGAGEKPPLSLRPGQEILVQVVKEPGGDKGPRVSQHITLPGECCVLLPTLRAYGVSRQIQEPERRTALQRLSEKAAPEDMGLVIRTAAQNASDESILKEAEALARHWKALREKASHIKAPAQVAPAGDMARRARRDAGARVVEAELSPAMEQALSKSLRRRVWLNSGAYLVFDYCEAMTVIDVNSGKFTGKRSLPDTLLRLNREAAREIARQIRLRNLGGILVMDFVDMETDEAREAVLQAFLEASEGDRAKRHVHGFSPAGLLEMTRRPLGPPLHTVLKTACPRCRGEGLAQKKNPFFYETAEGASQ